MPAVGTRHSAVEYALVVYPGHVRPMRIASLQPSTTLILAALNRLDLLCAHTRYCREVIPNLPGVTIHDAWSADESELITLKPDLILASVPYRLESLASILKAGLPVLTLAPHTLPDIAGDIRLIASLVHADPTPLLTRFEETLAATRHRASGFTKPLVHCEEWGKPLIHSQSWVAELIEAAGGTFLGSPGAHTTAASVAAAKPDVLLFSWCGAGNRVPLAKVIAQRSWQTLPAVQNRRVFCILDTLLNTPALNLLDGLAAIGHCLHSDAFPPCPDGHVIQI